MTVNDSQRNLPYKGRNDTHFKQEATSNATCN